MISLRLTLFGSPQIHLNDRLVQLKNRKAVALLIYLVLSQLPQSREKLVTVFWPEFSQERAFANLRETLRVIKKHLSDEWIDIRRQEVEVKESSTFWVDALEFQQHFHHVNTHDPGLSATCTQCLPLLLTAIDLYRDDFLRGFTLPDNPEFDEWQALHSDLFRENLDESFHRVVRFYTLHQQLLPAIDYARRWIAFFPWSETAHRELIRLYGLNHQRPAALQQYQECARMLQKEFDIEPEHETQELYEAILNEGLPLPRPPLLQREGKQGSLSPWERTGVRGAEHPNNLPAQITSFIGREAEVSTVSNMICQPSVRLLTLTGTGGSGKTRLALRIAERMITDFTDGVFFVSLAAISNSDFMVPTILKTLGLQAAGSASPLDVLNAYLKQKQLLLVLDNFEQVIEAAPVLMDLLAAVPDLKMLVTSRIILRISGEHEYLVSSMTLPDSTSPSSLEQLMQSEAVQLFTERTHTVRGNFSLTEDNASVVADICTRLDGLPLAIELAAARVRILSLQAILTHLAKPLEFLTVGARDLPARQQTLRNTIIWSHALLDEREQIVFRRLAVFVGGCTLEAAEAVGNISDDVDVLSSVEELVAHNLLTCVEEGDEPRCVMLETIREYAVERLADSGEAEMIRRQHARFFLSLAEEGEPKWHTRAQVIWLRRFERELDNFRAVLAWSIEHAIDVGVRLAAALAKFWDGGAYHREGREWLAKALANSQVCGTKIAGFRAKALNMAGLLAWDQGDSTTTYISEEESAILCRTLDDKPSLVVALKWLGMAVVSQGDLARARVLLDESLALSRQVQNIRELADTLYWHGVVAWGQRDNDQARVDARECILLAQEAGLITKFASGISILGHLAMDRGDYATAQSFYEKSAEFYQAIEFRQGIPRFLSFLGEALYAQGQYERATTCCQESLEYFQRSGSKFMAAWPQRNLGFVAFRQHCWREAHAYFVESLKVSLQHSDKQAIAACLTGFAGLAAAQELPERAAQLLGSTSALLEVLPDPDRFRHPVLQRDYEHIITAVRSTLGDDAFAIEHAKGRAMTLEQAIAYGVENPPVTEYQ